MNEILKKKIIIKRGKKYFLLVNFVNVPFVVDIKLYYNEKLKLKHTKKSKMYKYQKKHQGYRRLPIN